ncbi:MAG: RnfABCDGE type electron transport complex subunit D [Agathobacter sp.]|nr:RnfABCDGE type electron transport complex subunit D [Agathobacter sp.]MBQ3559127.1 RnfABCDGE type electron transport complex subunit D [Agathobacter sp.]
MSELFHVSSAPHVRAKTSTQNVMLWVIIAMIPTAVFGIWNFGFRALLLIVATVLSCVVSETVFNLIVKKKNTIGDLSAVVTGMILALNMPVTLPVWMAVLGGVFSIVVVKMLFGGLGQNFMNPALAGRCFLLLSFTSEMNNFVTDAYSGATPLAQLSAQKGILFTYATDAKLDVTDIPNLFIGAHGGTIGETSALCLLIGAAILVATKVISVRIPFAYLGTFSVLMLFFGTRGVATGEVAEKLASGAITFDALLTGALTFVLVHLLSGGIMFGAFFMATDYATSPITKKGQILFGICCGVLTFLFRNIGAAPEGVSYAIILSNLLVPLIEKITVPRAFGVVKVKKEGK